MTQKDALDILKLGHNVYLTGAAGAGKTHVLREYLNYLRMNNVTVGITASTGIAATHIGGMTIHSWSGIGVKDVLTQKDYKYLLQKVHLRNKLMYTKVLVIDEISMLHGYRLDMVDHVCRAFTMKDIPFGGMQVVMCGDFFQLPPISRNTAEESFAFDASVWQEMNLHVCYLSEQHRQSDDGIISVLRDIRNNQCTEDTVELLQSRFNKPIEGIASPTRLFTHNIDVDSINLRELGTISGGSHIYRTEKTGSPELCDMLIKSCLAPSSLALKKGALVMFVKNNYDKGYVNGTTGEVIGFEVGTDYPIVLTKEGEEIVAEPENWMLEDEGVVRASISQIPLRLAWAITIHKSQGMSLDAAQVDLSKSFVAGQGYVALSRLRTLSGLSLTGLNNMALQINQNVFEKDINFKVESEVSEKYLYEIPSSEIIKRQKSFIKSISKTY